MSDFTKPNFHVNDWQTNILVLNVRHILLISHQGSKKYFLPGSKPSAFITFYTISSPFPINNPILSFYLPLLLSSPFLSFPFLPLFLSFLSFALRSFIFLSSFLGNLSISATFLVARLPRHFVFLSPVSYPAKLFNSFTHAVCERLFD